MADFEGWSVGRLEERFAGLDRRLALLESAPKDIATLVLEVGHLREDIKEAKSAAEGVQKVLLGFFSALLVVLISAIVGAVIVL